MKIIFLLCVQRKNLIWMVGFIDDFLNVRSKTEVSVMFVQSNLFGLVAVD